GDLSGPASVHWALDLSSSSADASDFSGATSGDAVFAAGDGNIKPIVVNVVGDSFYEGMETFHVLLSSPVGATIGRSLTVGFILNDDALSPPIDTNAAANLVAENAANGTSVGITAASSAGAGTVLSYSLSDNAGGRFAINSSTGVVSVANGGLLDYE